ncbi:enoyl-CoA hydratase-related protein [Chloroflexota bacterium]
MEYKHIIYQPGKVARVILNRPKYRNALSYTVMEELLDAFRQGELDENVKVIVLSGEGPHFSTGHDLGTPEFLAECKERGWSTDDPETHYRNEEYYWSRTFLELRDILKPTIAMVQGLAVFAGTMLLSAMDIVFAADDAQFVIPTGQYLADAWMLGPRKAKELIFEHRALPAREALECGLINRVYPLDRLEKETLAFANRVADRNVIRDKMVINHMMDTMGFTTEMRDGAKALLQGRRRGLLGDLEAKGEGKGIAGVPLALENLRLKQESEKM